MLAEIEQLERLELEDAEARDSLLAFVQLFSPGYKPGWVHAELCTLLEQFVREVEENGEGPRYEWDMPPQVGKSQIVSRCWPAWTLGHHPDWPWLTGCYGLDFALGFGRDVRAIMESPRYQAIFPEAQLGHAGRTKGGALRADSFTLAAGGSYHALSIGGKGSGMPARIFSIDDPFKGREEADSPAYQQEAINWYTQVCQARLAPGGGIFLTNTRWGLKDLSGQIQAAQEKVSPELRRTWVRKAYPALAMEDEPNRPKGEAIHPERHTRREWEQRRAEMVGLGQEREWLAVYQQRPTNEEGTFIKREWINTYKIGSEPALVNYMGTDFAIGTKRQAHYSAFVAGGRAPDGKIYVRPGMFRERGSPGPSQVKALIDMIALNRVACVAWDSTMIGKSLEGFLDEEARARKVMLNTWKFTPSHDKLTHAAALRAMMASGMILFPDCAETTEIWIPALLSFGGSTSDGDWDEIDALSWLCTMVGEMCRGIEPKHKITTEQELEATRKAEILRRAQRPDVVKRRAERAAVHDLFHRPKR